MQPLSKGLAKGLKKNEFWKIIRQELPKAGYRQFTVEPNGSNFKLIIHCQDSTTNKAVDASYVFPRNAKSFHTALNFRSQINNYIRAFLRDKGLNPLNHDEGAHRVRQPGMYILKQPANIAPPLPVPVEETAASTNVVVTSTPTIEQPPVPEEVIVPGVSIPETIVADIARYGDAAMRSINEDQMILATFRIPLSQLNTVIETLHGTATFVSASDPSHIVEPIRVRKPVAVEQPVGLMYCRTEKNNDLFIKFVKHMDSIIEKAGRKDIPFVVADFKRFVRTDPKKIANMLRAIAQKGFAAQSGRGEWVRTEKQLELEPA